MTVSQTLDKYKKKFSEVQRYSTVKCWFTQIHQNQRTAVNCSIWTIYWFNLWIPKRVFEPKTKRRKPLETLGFGKFVGFRKYKVQKTSPSFIRWIHCDSSNKLIWTAVEILFCPTLIWWFTINYPYYLKQ